MQFGLTTDIIERIQKVFESNSKVDEVVVFGSRAKGNYREDSDIDLALKGKGISFDDILALSGQLDELNLPYKIDLVVYPTIIEKDFVGHIDRVGIIFYERVKKYKLSDIAIIVDCEHKTAPVVEVSDYISVRTANISNGKIDYSNCNKISKETYEEWTKRIRPASDDIILAREAPVGEVGIVKKGWNVCLGQRTVLIRANKNLIHPKYLLYYLLNPETKNELISRSTGSVVEHLNVKDIRDFSLKIPSLISEQISVIAILSDIDDKIDLLYRQNKTLEQLAETIFRQWFVEEADEGGAVKSLGQVFDIGIGRTPPRKEQQWFTTNPDDVRWISIKDMGTSGMYIYTVSEYLTQEAVERYSVPLIPKNTVILSFKMTIGRLAITTEKMVSNEAIAHFKQLENSCMFPEFLYLFLKTYRWQELGSTSSIVESINSQMIKEMEIVIPDEKKLSVFKNLIKPHFDKIKGNQIQIRNLAQLRDTLLPKLVSGEVRLEMN